MQGSSGAAVAAFFVGTADPRIDVRGFKARVPVPPRLRFYSSAKEKVQRGGRVFLSETIRIRRRRGGFRRARETTHASHSLETRQLAKPRYSAASGFLRTVVCHAFVSREALVSRRVSLAKCSVTPEIHFYTLLPGHCVSGVASLTTPRVPLCSCLHAVSFVGANFVPRPVEFSK